MLMYSWMVWMEKAPQRYDWAVKLLTFGKVNKMKEDIAAQIKEGDKVLDVGCGSGTLGMMCLEKGAYFSGLDTSDFMLHEFRRKTQDGRFADRLELVKDSVTQLQKHFDENSLDTIVSTMAIGEFPKEYIEYIFKSCHTLLKPGGLLLIGDEVWPTNPISSGIYRIVMGLMYLPQFILLRRVTSPIKHLDGLIQSAGFHIQNIKHYSFSTFQLVTAKK